MWESGQDRIVQLEDNLRCATLLHDDATRDHSGNKHSMSCCQWALSKDSTEWQLLPGLSESLAWELRLHVA